MNSQLCILLALTVSLSACNGKPPASSTAEAAPARPAAQGGPSAGSDSDKCPLRAADLDKLTPHRWQVAQYKADQPFIPNGTIRIDYCELIGKDDKGTMLAGVMVNIARGDNAGAFAKHWRAACADSLMPDMRGNVQPVRGVPGGHQCVTAKGSSSFYWIEAPGKTIEIQPEDTVVKWPEILPQVLAAAAR